MKVQKIHNILIFSRKYYAYSLMLILTLFAGFCVTVFSSTSNHFNYVNELIDCNIYEYGEVDLEYICNISRCEYIYQKDHNGFAFFEKNDNRLSYKNTVQSSEVDDFTNIYKDIYFSDSQLMIYNKTSNAYISLDYTSNLMSIFENFLILSIFIVLSTVYLLYKTYSREKNDAMLQNVGNEAILANKSMVMITENIHHELNTPLDVIDNKFEKIHKVLNAYIVSEHTAWLEADAEREVTDEKRIHNKKIIRLEKDFEFIKVSLEQIFAILNKMKNFKTLRYSNGDKTFYDIAEGAFRILSISNSGFDYFIDDDLRNYRMNNDIIRNIDVLNVLLNHFKNSVEANASVLKVSVEFKKGDLTIFINDNGAGIPPDLIKDIFLPNFSTKQIGDSIRGNGMYLNKHIMQEAGGDIVIHKTSNKGTIVAVTISAKEHAYVPSISI